MHATPTPSSSLVIPYPAARRAAWTAHSRAAVGRSRRVGVEVAIGSGAADVGSRLGAHVECFVLPGLTDEQMRLLASAEEHDAALPTLAAALRLLLSLGLRPADAGRVMGLSARAEVSRLNAIAAMPPAVLAKLARLGLTRNHARWLLGLPEAAALKGLDSLEKDARARSKGRSRRQLQDHPFRAQITVAAVRAWRAAFDAEASAAAAGAPSPTAAPDPTLAAAAAAEAVRLTEMLKASVEIEAVANSDERRVRLGFYSVEDLAGLMAQLGAARGEAPVPKEGAGMRFVTLDGVTDDELAYLVGRSDD